MNVPCESFCCALSHPQGSSRADTDSLTTCLDGFKKPFQSNFRKKLLGHTSAALDGKVKSLLCPGQVLSVARATFSADRNVMFPYSTLQKGMFVPHKVFIWTFHNIVTCWTQPCGQCIGLVWADLEDVFDALPLGVVPLLTVQLAVGVADELQQPLGLDVNQHRVLQGTAVLRQGPETALAHPLLTEDSRRDEWRERDHQWVYPEQGLG